MRLYFNLQPSYAHLREALRDPKALGNTIFFLYLTYALVRDADANIVVLGINLFATAIWLIVLLNEIGLATLRHEAVAKGFQRPLPPRYKPVFERMLSGWGIYIYLIGLGCILAAFLPGAGEDGLDPFLFAARLLLLGAAWYGITYSNTRYTAWYEEIRPDDNDGGGGWDDEFAPDPTPLDRLAL